MSWCLYCQKDHMEGRGTQVRPTGLESQPDPTVDGSNPCPSSIYWSDHPPLFPWIAAEMFGALLWMCMIYIILVKRWV